MGPWKKKRPSSTDFFAVRTDHFSFNEFQFLFDARDAYNSHFPAEIFRVLKEKEEKQYGEYRTGRLVLEICVANVGTPFRDNDHWQRSTCASMQGLLTQSFPETPLEFESSGSAIMLIHSLLNYGSFPFE
jgi:hypothetical protein